MSPTLVTDGRGSSTIATTETSTNHCNRGATQPLHLWVRRVLSIFLRVADGVVVSARAEHILVFSKIFLVGKVPIIQQCSSSVQIQKRMALRQQYPSRTYYGTRQATKREIKIPVCLERGFPCILTADGSATAAEAWYR